MYYTCVRVIICSTCVSVDCVSHHVLQSPEQVASLCRVNGVRTRQVMEEENKVNDGGGKEEGRKEGEETKMERTGEDIGDKMNEVDGDKQEGRKKDVGKKNEEEGGESVQKTETGRSETQPFTSYAYVMADCR